MNLFQPASSFHPAPASTRPLSSIPAERKTTVPITRVTLEPGKWETQTPMQMERNDKLQYQLSKYREQGRWKYMRITSRLINPFEVVTHLLPSTIISRGYCKLWQLIQDHDISSFLDERFGANGERRTLHLCEAPGGFIQCVEAVFPTVRWKATSIQANVAFAFGQSEKGSVIRLPEAEGTLLNRTNLEHLCECPDKVHLVTGDGSKGPKSATSEENDSWALICAETVVALNALEPGGVFVCKIFEFYLLSTQSILWVLYKTFDQVEIHKPTTSRPCNSEKFVVATGFRPGNEALKSRLLESCHAGLTNGFINNIEPPLPWVSWMTVLQNQFTLAREQWQEKAVEACDILIDACPFLMQEQFAKLYDAAVQDENIRAFGKRFVDKYKMTPDDALISAVQINDLFKSLQQQNVY